MGIVPENPNHGIFAKIKTITMFNAIYTEEMYIAERNAYFIEEGGMSSRILQQLSMDFIIRFCEKLDQADEDEASSAAGYKKGRTGDGTDYAMWGFALWGDYEEDEEGGGEVWNWKRFYERALRKSMRHTVDLCSFNSPAELSAYIFELD